MPANDEFNIQIQNSEEIFIVDCFNLTGQIILSTEIHRSSIRKLSTRNWSEGVYYIGFTSKHNIFTHKLIISH